MTLPPYADRLGITVAAGNDAILLVMPGADGVMGRPGFLHGGAIGGLLEMAAIVALRAALGAEAGGGASGDTLLASEDTGIKPINVTVDFMRGGRDKLTFARGTVTRLGTRVANVEASAWQDDAARPIAAARMNYLIVRA